MRIGFNFRGLLASAKTNPLQAEIENAKEVVDQRRLRLFIRFCQGVSISLFGIFLVRAYNTNFKDLYLLTLPALSILNLLTAWAVKRYSTHRQAIIMGLMLMALGINGLRTYQTGGLSSATMYWLPVLTAVAHLFLNRKLFHVFVGLVLGFVFLTYLGTIYDLFPPPPSADPLGVSSVLFMSLVLLTFLMSASKRFQEQADKDFQRAVQMKNEHENMIRLGEVAGNLGHELSNPLMVMQSKLIRLKMNPKNTIEDYEREIQDLHRQSHRLVDILKTVRSFSYVDARPSTKPMSLHDIRTLIFEEAEESLRENVRFQFISETTLETELESNPTLIRILISNLFRNANDAISDSPAPWIKASLRTPKTNRLQIVITDSGTGLTPQMFEKIQESGFTTKPQGKGTGLGMAIARRIIEQLNGTWHLNDSSPTTEIVIEFPILQ